MSLVASVIIPTYNRKKLLARSLSALGQQKPASWEVVVVDDGSPDAVPDSILEYLGKIPGRLVRLDKNLGRSGARNAGVEAAGGEIIIFLDDDMEVLPGCIEAHLKQHADTERAAVIGHFAFPPSKNLLGISKYLASRGVYKLKEGENVHYRYFITGNSSVRRALLKEVGGFDETMTRWGGEDLELGYRLHTAGAIFIYAPDAMSWNHGERSIDEICDLSREFGRFGIPELVNRHPELGLFFKLELIAPYSQKLGLTPAWLMTRLATHPLLAAGVQRAVSATGRWRWPDLVYHYLIAASWRSGLDEAYR